MKDKLNHRYEGDPKRMYDFMNEFDVHCPKCDDEAIITVPLYFKYAEAELKCKHCFFSEKAKSRERYRATSKARCKECREFLVINIEERKEIPAYVNIVCEHCRTVNKVQENWESYLMKYSEEGIIDPAFGLPLWYQENVKDEILWAFNKAHLKEIKNYVAAELRERTTDRFKMTMVEKLPNFIKSAKNREEVLKAIEKMESKKK